MKEKRDMISANDLLVDSKMESGNDVKTIDEWLHILEISDIWLRRKIYSNKWRNLVEKTGWEYVCMFADIVLTTLASSPSLSRYLPYVIPVLTA